MIYNLYHLITLRYNIIKISNKLSNILTFIFLVLQLVVKASKFFFFILEVCHHCSLTIKSL